MNYKHKLRDDDILISTDSSRDTNNGLAGFGVFIKDYNKLHYFHQPLGKRFNQYGELFAIGKSEMLLQICNVSTDNRRVIIQTDSLSNFLTLITTPKNLHKCPDETLFKSTQQYLKRIKALLWKVKSHTKPEQFYNGIANTLANLGRLNPANNRNLKISLDSNEHSILFHKTSPTTNPQLLTGYADLSVSMEFRDVVFDRDGTRIFHYYYLNEIRSIDMSPQRNSNILKIIFLPVS